MPSSLCDFHYSMRQGFGIEHANSKITGIFDNGVNAYQPLFQTKIHGEHDGKNYLVQSSETENNLLFFYM